MSYNGSQTKTLKNDWPKDTKFTLLCMGYKGPTMIWFSCPTCNPASNPPLNCSLHSHRIQQLPYYFTAFIQYPQFRTPFLQLITDKCLLHRLASVPAAACLPPSPPRGSCLPSVTPWFGSWHRKLRPSPPRPLLCGTDTKPSRVSSCSQHWAQHLVFNSY